MTTIAFLVLRDVTGATVSAATRRVQSVSAENPKVTASFRYRKANLVRDIKVYPDSFSPISFEANTLGPQSVPLRSSGHAVLEPAVDGFFATDGLRSDIFPNAMPPDCADRLILGSRSNTADEVCRIAPEFAPEFRHLARSREHSRAIGC